VFPVRCVWAISAHARTRVMIHLVLGMTSTAHHYVAMVYVQTADQNALPRSRGIRPFVSVTIMHLRL
jgi:hypothetical protein